MGTYLLHKHHDFGGLHCSSVSRNSDHLFDLVLSKHHAFLLSLEKRVHIENISCGLDLIVPKSAHTSESLFVASL